MTIFKQRIDDLRDKIDGYNAAYYGRSESLISDVEYDALFKELGDLERLYPKYDSPDSPTRRGGFGIKKI